MAITPRSSWWTLSKIRADVALGTREGTISDADLNKYINKAYSQIYFDEAWQEKVLGETITLVSAQAVYELPVTIDSVIAAHDSSNMLLSEGELNHWVEFGAEASSGKSYRIRHQGVNVELYPVPTVTEAGETIVIRGYRELAHYNTGGVIVAGEMSVDTDYPLLHPSLHQVISLLSQVMAIEDAREKGGALAAKTQRYVHMYKQAKYSILHGTKYPGCVRIMR